VSVLVIEGFVVPATPQNQTGEASFGDFGPAYSGKMRSDKRGDHRTIEITTDPMTEAESLILLQILRTPGPLRCSGDMIGAETDFHMGPRSRQQISHNLFLVTFSMRETDTLTPELLFSFHGDAPGPYSFDRTGTASSVDADGLLISVAEDVARFPYQFEDGVISATRALSMERTVENLCTWSDALTNWTSVIGSPVVTDAADSLGVLDLSKVEDDAAGAQEAKGLNVTYTGDADKAVAFFIAEPDTAAASGAEFLVWDATAGASRFRVTITWSGGVPTVTPIVGSLFGTPTFVGLSALGKRVYDVQGLAASVVAANTNRVEIQPAGVADAETGDIYIGGVRTGDTASPIGSYILTAGSTATRGAEYWRTPYLHAPQGDTTVYVKLREGSATNWSLVGGASPRIIHLGRSDDTLARLLLYKPQGTADYRFQVFNAAASSSTASRAMTPTRGDIIELRGVLRRITDTTVACVLGASKNGATESVSAAGTTIDLPAAWADDVLALGSLSASAGQGDVELITAFGATGEYTMAECRKLAGARLWQRVA
jgi:hypothetical protein